MGFVAPEINGTPLEQARSREKKIMKFSKSSLIWYKTFIIDAKMNFIKFLEPKREI